MMDIFSGVKHVQFSRGYSNISSVEDIRYCGDINQQTSGVEELAALD